jgi:hypothetical protein
MLRKMESADINWKQSKWNKPPSTSSSRPTSRIRYMEVSQYHHEDLGTLASQDRTRGLEVSLGEIQAADL